MIPAQSTTCPESEAARGKKVECNHQKLSMTGGKAHYFIRKFNKARNITYHVLLTKSDFLVIILLLLKQYGRR